MVRHWRIVLALALLAWTPACFERHGGSGEGPTSTGGGKAPGRAGTGPGRAGSDAQKPPVKPVDLPADPPRCVVSAATSEIATGSLDKVDLLFVIDNSDSMAEEQQALLAAFPSLLARLTSGRLDSGREFSPVKDIHFGVVTTDLGAIGASAAQGCEGLGDDGVIRHDPSAARAGCQSTYPPFLSYYAGGASTEVVANDLACVADVGVEGCTIRQPLEAALKALWPSVDPGAENGQNRIMFLPDEMGFGALGHGDQENDGFLRRDQLLGPSVLAIVVVTDHDDCSTFEPNTYASKSGRPTRLACAATPSGLYPLERYIRGYDALREDMPGLVVFSVIAGIPPDLVEAADYAKIDWRDAPMRDRFYDSVLNDQRMTLTVDPSGMDLLPTCNYDKNFAYPPRRLVQVAQGFGVNGSVHSLCGANFEPAIDGVLERIAEHLGETCLGTRLARAADGTVSCGVDWVLPSLPAAPGTPTSCDSPDLPFLSRPTDRADMDDQGRTICQVAQLAVAGGQPQPTQWGGKTLTEGWYYDTSATFSCGGRVVFTPAAKPPESVQVRMHCLDAVNPPEGGVCSVSPASGDGDSVGDACLPGSIPQGGFDDTRVYLDTAQHACGGAPCVAFHLRGDPRTGCIPRPGTSTAPPVVCADPQEVRDRAYCTCRCNAPPGTPECACPDGFACVTAFDVGGAAVAGGYCIREGTFAQ